MISLEPNSAAVYFPLEIQSELLSQKVPEETRDKTKKLLAGVEMNVMTHHGMFVQIENVVIYMLTRNTGKTTKTHNVIGKAPVECRYSILILAQEQSRGLKLSICADTFPTIK
jgi:hypothetical protein